MSYSGLDGEEGGDPSPLSAAGRKESLKDVELSFPVERTEEHSTAEELKAAEANDEVAGESGGDGGDMTEGEGGGKKKKKREVWDNRFQFVLTLVGFAVGLGNVWRFSFRVASNGGSAFLIPYMVMLFVLGIPLFYLELSFGQAIKAGSIKAWHKVAPNLVGIGISSFIINCFIAVYYNVIIAWVLYFLFHSFRSHLPWGFCFGEYTLNYQRNESRVFLDYIRRNTSYGNRSELEILSCFNRSTEYFWYGSAVEVSRGVAEAGKFNWEMMLWLLLAWVIVYLCLFKGIQSSGKIVYFTATFPYVVLICLFFRGVTLPGAGDGLRYLFLPSGGRAWFAQLFSPQVWLEAATQIFFSLGLSLGVLIALASYTKPRYNTLVDSFIVCLTNSFTSIFASIIVFSIVGFRAQQLGVEPSLLTTGPGLAFVVFSQALLYMPGAPFWAIMFFFMLLLLGLDSQFASLEGILTVVRDIPVCKKIRKEILVALICIAFFLVTFPFVLGNGVYLFELFDQFAGTIPLLLVGFAEYIAVAWVFGVSRFFREVAKPISLPLRVIWILMWKWVGPIVMFVIFVASVIVEIIDPLKYTVYRDFSELEEVYPSWAQFIGAVIVLIAVLPIPIILIVRLVLYQSAREEFVQFFKNIKSDTGQLLRDIANWRYRRGVWSPRQTQGDLDILYEHAETPYQWELGDSLPPGDGTTVQISPNGEVEFKIAPVKENGQTDST